ncbi:hypothetical protein, partial [Kitasatospora sp. NPDC093558]|uniref:hypothetical protein n=1 Tax=Kitasatospora sp. NPDC093558 TaxID=3155201 RepID=UPI00343ABF6D
RTLPSSRLPAGPPGASFFRVSSLPDVFRSVFPEFLSSDSRWRDFLQLRSEAYQSFRSARFAGFASSEGAHFVKRARLDSAVS